METLACRSCSHSISRSPIHSCFYNSIGTPFRLIAKGHLDTSLADMWVRDPGSFLAGKPHKSMSCWEYLTQNHPQQDVIMSWIKDGINIHEFIVPFRGTYRRKRYHHSFPPDAIFPNNKSCIPQAQVISTEIEKKIAMGAMTALGRVGEVPPPRMVMPSNAWFTTSNISTVS